MCHLKCITPGNSITSQMHQTNTINIHIRSSKQWSDLLCALAIKFGIKVRRGGAEISIKFIARTVCMGGFVQTVHQCRILFPNTHVRPHLFTYSQAKWKNASNMVAGNGIFWQSIPKMHTFKMFGRSFWTEWRDWRGKKIWNSTKCDKRCCETETFRQKNDIN